MAITVPTPEYQGAQSLGGVEGQAAQTPYQNLQLPDLSFNARTLGQLGGVIGDFAKEMQRRHEETSLLEMQQAYSEFERDLMYNLDTGVMKTEKRGALGVTERVRAETTAFFDQYTKDNKTLTRSAMMAMTAFSQQRQTSLLDTAARHELSENERYRAEMKAAASANAIATAALSFVSDTALADQKKIIISSTASQYEGSPDVTPEMVADITARRVDEMHRAAISAALMADTKAGIARAAALYASGIESGELILTENDSLTRAVLFSTEEDGYSIAIDLLLAETGGDLAAAAALVPTMPNANAYDRAKITEELEARMRVQERVGNQAQKALEARALELAIAGRLSEMPKFEKAQIPEAILDRYEGINSNRVTYSDSATLNRLSSLTIEAWADVNLADYERLLTQDDIRLMSITQGNAAREVQKLAEARATQPVGSTVTQIVDELGRRAGLVGTAKADELATFNLGMNDFIVTFKAANDGKDPSQDELSVEADRLQMRVVTAEGTFMNTRQTLAEVLQRPPALVDDSGQPVDAADVRAFIREVVSIQGDSAILTTESLQALYLAYLAAQ